MLVLARFTTAFSLIVCLWLSNRFQQSLTAQQPLVEVAELAIVNANGLVCDAAMSRFTAIAVRDGRIVAIGQRTDIEPFLGRSTQVIDGAGMTVTPGLIDSHLHFLGLGQSLQMLDLSQADSWEKI